MSDKKNFDPSDRSVYVPDTQTSYHLRDEDKVGVGSPSSIENYIDNALDLNELLLSSPPAATFFIRVRGDSMEKAGIKNNDILIVDRAAGVSDNKIVIARLGDEMTVKRIRRVGDHMFLMPESADDAEKYKPIKITEDIDFEIWGVVTAVIHQV